MEHSNDHNIQFWVAEGNFLYRMRKLEISKKYTDNTTNHLNSYNPKQCDLSFNICIIFILCIYIFATAFSVTLSFNRNYYEI